jgi:hypothetical protein
MKSYAVLDAENKVSNVIVAGSLDIAEKVTNAVCIFVTDETKSPHIGLSYVDGIFEQPEPIALEPIIEEDI